MKFRIAPDERSGVYDVTCAGKLVARFDQAADAKRLAEAWDAVRPHIGPLLETHLKASIASLAAATALLGDEA